MSHSPRSLSIMTKEQRLLSDLVLVADEYILKKNDIPKLREQLLQDLKLLNNFELAQFYIYSAHLITLIHFISEEYWLAQRKQTSVQVSFKDFLDLYLEVELSSIHFLHDYLRNSSVPKLKNLIKHAQVFVQASLVFIMQQESFDQKEFATKALYEMSVLYKFEDELNKKLSLLQKNTNWSNYRTFDDMDIIFNLDYTLDIGMRTDMKTNERLYEGAGVGVQSGYSNIILALSYLNPPMGSTLVDLGSGYGRVGLTLGLMRTDMNFLGFEYVKHRVDVANLTCEKFELCKKIHFYHQDLSDPGFLLPEAEIYYLYDPFSRQTYEFILQQLINLSHTKKITIVTKGNAKEWFMPISIENKWQQPTHFENSNICIFQN